MKNPNEKMGRWDYRALNTPEMEIYAVHFI